MEACDEHDAPTTTEPRAATAGSSRPPGWEARRADFQRLGAPLSQWMVEAIALAARATACSSSPPARAHGLTGRRAGRSPAARCSSPTAAEADGRGRAAQRRGGGRRRTSSFKVMEAEWIDVPTATIDGVLCRFGYMLLADPETRAARDPARAQARAAASRWRCGTRSSATPGSASCARVMVEQGLGQPRRPGRARPVPLRRARRGCRSCWRARASPTSQVEPLDLEQRAASLDDWWEHLQDTSAATRRRWPGWRPRSTIACVTPSTRGYQEYVRDDGSLSIPARALVAAASA